MKTDSPGPAGGGLDHEAFVQMNQSPEFQRLKTAFRRFVFPMTAAFLFWYLLYVVLSAYARGFMSTKVVGNINIALVFGLLQFVSTFLIAWAYERYARNKLEPLAAAVHPPVAVAPTAAPLEPAKAGPAKAEEGEDGEDGTAGDGSGEGSSDGSADGPEEGKK